MKINLFDLKDDQNIVLEETISGPALELESTFVRFIKPIRVRAELWKTEKQLVAQVHMEGERSITCSRCLEEFNKLFEKDTTLYYDITGLNCIVLDPDIRDEILIDHPIQMLCREDCRGLCPLCGQNRNIKLCDCPHKGD